MTYTERLAEFLRRKLPSDLKISELLGYAFSEGYAAGRLDANPVRINRSNEERLDQLEQDMAQLWAELGRRNR